jgi:hypothetical protein
MGRGRGDRADRGGVGIEPRVGTKDYDQARSAPLDITACDSSPDIRRVPACNICKLTPYRKWRRIAGGSRTTPAPRSIGRPFFTGAEIKNL